MSRHLWKKKNNSWCWSVKPSVYVKILSLHATHILHVHFHAFLLCCLISVFYCFSSMTIFWVVPEMSSDINPLYWRTVSLLFPFLKIAGETKNKFWPEIGDGVLLYLYFVLKHAPCPIVIIMVPLCFHQLIVHQLSFDTT